MPRKSMAVLHNRNSLDERFAARAKAGSLRYNRLMRRLLPTAAIAWLFVFALAMLGLAGAKATSKRRAHKGICARRARCDCRTLGSRSRPVRSRQWFADLYLLWLVADGKFAWTLKAPDAELKDRKDKVIGQHSAGPTWKLKDGSEVTGKGCGCTSTRSIPTRFPGCW